MSPQFYEMNLETQPPAFMPVGLNWDNLVDITTITSTWRRYYDVKTGIIHDGKVYHDSYLKELEHNN